MTRTQSSYRAALLSAYDSTHFGSIRDHSINGFRKQAPVYRRLFAKLLPEDLDAPILDLGCGTGGFLYFLKKAGYRRVVGVDISPEQVATAKHLGIENVECNDLLSFLRTKRQTYRLITVLDVLEHLTKQTVFDCLGLCYNALVPGGMLVLQAPNTDGPLGARLRYADFTHEVAFTQTSIAQLLRVAGFSRIRVLPIMPVVHGPLSAGRYVLWQTLAFFVRIYLATETGTARGHILTQNLLAVAAKPGSDFGGEADVSPK